MVDYLYLVLAEDKLLVLLLGLEVEHLGPERGGPLEGYGVDFGVVGVDVPLADKIQPFKNFRANA